jgi:hypothetical protein
VNGTGTCSKNININLSNNDLLAVEVKNDFTGSGIMTYTYTLLYD